MKGKIEEDDMLSPYGQFPSHNRVLLQQINHLCSCSLVVSQKASDMGASVVAPNRDGKSVPGRASVLKICPSRFQSKSSVWTFPPRRLGRVASDLQ